MGIATDSTDIARWTAPTLVLIGGLACLWLTARLVSALADAWLGDPAAAPVDPGTSARWTQVEPESLARWHLFGSALQVTDPRSAVAVPETGLDLSLVGTLADADPGAGVAIIADGGGRQSAYRVGAMLPGGARLRAIHSDHVVLVHNGRDEVLRLPREVAATVSSGGQRGSAMMQDPGRTPSAGSPIAPVAVSGLETVDWGAVQQQLRIDPADLARQIRILPVLEGGQMIGVRLSGGANTPLLAKLGLRPDDVIIAVNGVSVLDTGRAHQVMSAIASADRASVTIRRDGREETLNVSLQ